MAWNVACQARTTPMAINSSVYYMYLNLAIWNEISMGTGWQIPVYQVRPSVMWVQIIYFSKGTSDWGKRQQMQHCINKHFYLIEIGRSWPKLIKVDRFYLIHWWTFFGWSVHQTLINHTFWLTLINFDQLWITSNVDSEVDKNFIYGHRLIMRRRNTGV